MLSYCLEGRGNPKNRRQTVLVLKIHGEHKLSIALKK